MEQLVMHDAVESTGQKPAGRWIAPFLKSSGSTKRLFLIFRKPFI